MTEYGTKTWRDVDFEDLFPDRKKGRIIGMTFPKTDTHLALEPAILTVLPPGDKVEFDMLNRDYNDNDVKCYLCSVYIAGMDEFVEWALKHDKRKIIVGGYHPTAFPEDFVRYADKVVQGPCDDIWATCVIVGQVVRGVVSNKNLPRRDLYDVKNNYQIIPLSLLDSTAMQNPRTGSFSAVSAYTSMPTDIAAGPRPLSGRSWELARCSASRWMVARRRNMLSSGRTKRFVAGWTRRAACLLKPLPDIQC